MCGICVIALAIMRTQGAALARVDTQALAPAVYCTGRRPDAAGGWARAYEGGTSAQRKVGCCCWVPVKWPQGLCNFWVGVPPPPRRRPPSSRHVPLTHPAADRDERRSGPVHGPSRPRSDSVMGGSRRRRGLDHGGLADSEGSPGPAPVCGPPGGPNQGRVGGARKAESEKRSKREARAFAFLSANFCCLFSFKSRTLRLRARCYHSVASVGRPYSG